MEKIVRILLVTGVIATCLAAPSVATAQPPWPPFCEEISLPSRDPHYQDPQLTLTCVPPDWNGNLVMYAHGYVPAQAPLALPLEELTLPDGTFMPNILLAQGFAFATTSYHKNGYAVEQAWRDVNDLLRHIETLVPPDSLQKVFLVGASEGGEIAALMIEHFPEKYAGALAMCGPVGGGPYQVRYLSDFRAAFDYFFPDVFPFGITDVPEDQYLEWPNDVQAIALALASDPGATLQLYSVSGAAFDPLDPTTMLAAAQAILFYSIWGTNDLVATAGGVPYDNRSTMFSGSLDDVALNDGIERVASDGRARAYLRRFYQTTGELQRPLVTLHNTLDPVVPFQHEVIYRGLVAYAGRGDYLTTLPVARYGHCNFTAQEIVGAFEMLLLQASAQAGP
jgi:pimeloyl-ACP methyl ester carboxylesterase